MSPNRILIIGGGIGGLALAPGCKKHNIPFHVYEKDRTEAYRAQGYRIRIGGLAISALKHLLDEKTYTDFELSCADDRTSDMLEIDAETGRVDEPKVGEDVRANLDGREVEGRCVDRSAFRNVLIKHWREDEISYDKVFERYELVDGGVVAYFADGSQASETLLVGADGRGSNERKQLLPQLELLETGVRCIYGKSPLTPKLLETLTGPTSERMSFVKDHSQEDLSIMGVEPITFPNRSTLQARGIAVPQDYIFWVLTAASDALGLGGEGKRYLSPSESEQQALKVTQHWHPTLRSIITSQQSGESSAFSITAVAAELPVWTPNPHVTLTGDAIHPMAPTGSGAVMALNDASLLCKGVEEKGVGVEAVGRYEEKMGSVAGEAIRSSWMAVRIVAGMKRSGEKH